MRKALFLIAIGAIYRLVPHPWNLVPMGALALYAGASLPRRWAWIVPVAAMGLSDLVLDYAIGRPLSDPSRWIIYASFALTTLMGPLARRPKVGPWLLPVLSLSASALFFLTSNFGAWLVPEMNYPRNLGRTALLLRRRDSVHPPDDPGRPGGHRRFVWTGSDPRASQSPAAGSRGVAPAQSKTLRLPETDPVAQLLVSVRSADEARSALAGGASIIDVKEPDHGSLGPAPWSVWREVYTAVSTAAPISVALGELPDWLGHRLSSHSRRRRGPAFRFASWALPEPTLDWR